MQQAPATAAPRVPAIEQVLDLVCGAAPKAGENTHIFVGRCVKVLQGRKERSQLKRAIMETLNELGIRAVDPATSAQAVLNACRLEAQ